MASVTELVAVFVIVVFAIGATFGGILIVAAGIKAEEGVARQRHLDRMRRSTARYDESASTLYDEPTSTMTRGVRRLTGAGHGSRD